MYTTPPPPPPSGHELRRMLHRRVIVDILWRKYDDLQKTVAFATSEGINDLLDDRALAVALYHEDSKTVDSILSTTLSTNISLAKDDIKALLFLMPHKIEHSRDVLTKYDLELDFDQAEIDTVHPKEILKWVTALKTALTDLSATSLKKEINNHFENIENYFLIRALLDHQMDIVKEILPYCLTHPHTQEEGSVKALNLDEALIHMMETSLDMADKTMAKLKTFDCAVKPLSLESFYTIINQTPQDDRAEALRILKENNVLAIAAPDFRQHIIEQWLKDGMVPHNQHVIKYHRAYARILFDQNACIHEKDITYIKQLYKKHRQKRIFGAPKTQDVFFDIAKTLEETTFFDHPLFREKEMLFLGKTATDSLKNFFNTKANEKRQKRSKEKEIDPKNRSNKNHDLRKKP